MLCARVNALLRRTRMPAPAQAPILGDSEPITNTAARPVLVRGQAVELTLPECRLLTYLARGYRFAG